MSARPGRPRIGRRPSSAIFLGDANYAASPPALPDPPRTPSPSSPTSTGGSGLPSPPATTSGGSTGDAPVRRAHVPATPSRNVDFASSYAEEAEDDEDDEGEHTARFLRKPVPLTHGRVAALGRISDLNQRSRDVSAGLGARIHRRAYWLIRSCRSSTGSRRARARPAPRRH
jgi:hypothetical protein